MLEKKYNHLEVEKDKYKKWKESGYFNSGNLSKELYCIVIPPPNVTGKLHLGHAWDTTLQDMIIRYKDLIGKNVILPIVNKKNSIVGDEHADMEFGTGVVKRIPFGTKLKNMLKVKGSLGYSY